jgi:hypothetical protein
MARKNTTTKGVHETSPVKFFIFMALSFLFCDQDKKVPKIIPRFYQVSAGFSKKTLRDAWSTTTNSALD